MIIFEWICSLFSKKQTEPAAQEKPLPVIPVPPPRPIPATPTTTFFLEALKYTFVNEGGFSNIKEDKGGATNFGIIREELARWRHHDVTPQDVKEMKREEAEVIYKAWYWDALKLSRIENKNVAIALFDRAVLNGLTGVSRHVKNVLAVEQDEKANFDAHIDTINDTNPRAFVMRLADQCEAKHRSNVEANPTQRRFLYGWLNRVNRMRKELGDGTVRPIEQWIKDASGRS